MKLVLMLPQWLVSEAIHFWTLLPFGIIIIIIIIIIL